MSKLKTPSLKVELAYVPASDYKERLAKVLALLLRPHVGEEVKVAEENQVVEDHRKENRKATCALEDTGGQRG